MNWFYVEAGQQAGPVDDAQLAELVRTGRVTSETLVWREGMANWQPYREASGAGSVATAAPPQASLRMAAPAATAADEAVCAECRGVFKKQDMIAFGDSYVCANCKPVFMQRMAEGAQLLAAGQMHYAGFWIRVGAKIIDGLILFTVFGLPSMIISVSTVMSGRPPSARTQILQVFLSVIAFGAHIAYNTFFLGKFGATPGKMACKIHVLTSQGAPIGYGRAAGRFFAEILSAIICYIGYIMVGFDKEKRGLHDHICDTRVVYK